MIKDIKKFWIYILAFVIINFISFNVLTILSEPYEVADLFAPMFLVFQVAVIISSFFPALLLTFVLFSKTTDYGQQLSVIMFSVVIFTFLIVSQIFLALLFFEQEDWDQIYLDKTLSLPYDITIDQSKILTYYEVTTQIFMLLMQNTGSAFFGFWFARKLKGVT